MSSWYSTSDTSHLTSAGAAGGSIVLVSVRKIQSACTIFGLYRFDLYQVCISSVFVQIQKRLMERWLKLAEVERKQAMQPLEGLANTGPLNIRFHHPSEPKVRVQQSLIIDCDEWRFEWFSVNERFWFSGELRGLTVVLKCFGIGECDVIGWSWIGRVWLRVWLRGIWISEDVTVGWRNLFVKTTI